MCQRADTAVNSRDLFKHAPFSAPSNARRVPVISIEVPAAGGLLRLRMAAAAAAAPPPPVPLLQRESWRRAHVFTPLSRAKLTAELSYGIAARAVPPRCFARRFGRGGAACSAPAEAGAPLTGALVFSLDRDFSKRISRHDKIAFFGHFVLRLQTIF